MCACQTEFLSRAVSLRRRRMLVGTSASMSDSSSPYTELCECHVFVRACTSSSSVLSGHRSSQNGGTRTSVVVMVGIVRHVLKHELARRSLSTRLCHISCMKSPSAEQQSRGRVSSAISAGGLSDPYDIFWMNIKTFGPSLQLPS